MEDDKRLVAALDRDVRVVLRAIAGSAVEELCLERGNVRISLKRSFEPAPTSVATDGGVAPELPASHETEPATARSIQVRSAHVGLFHRSREAGGPILAEEGTPVEAGQAIGVVKTLGMSADVEAPAAGILAEVRAQDGEPVDFGQVLAVIALD